MPGPALQGLGSHYSAELVRSLAWSYTSNPQSAGSRPTSRVRQSEPHCRGQRDIEGNEQDDGRREAAEARGDSRHEGVPAEDMRVVEQAPCSAHVRRRPQTL